MNSAMGLTAGSDIGKMIASGMIGGLFSVAGGGHFASGFLAAGVGALPGPNFGDPIANGVASSVLGGFASVLGGGKFANGAITAAFAYAANTRLQSSFEEEAEREEDYRAALIARGIDPDNTAVPAAVRAQIRDIIGSADFRTAARSIYDLDVTLHHETGGIQVYIQANGVVNIVPFVGTPAVCSAASSACMNAPPPDPAKGRILFEWHVHPNNLSGANLPSERDLQRSLQFNHLPGAIWVNRGDYFPKPVIYQANCLSGSTCK